MLRNFIQDLSYHCGILVADLIIVNIKYYDVLFPIDDLICYTFVVWIEHKAHVLEGRGVQLVLK